MLTKKTLLITIVYDFTYKISNYITLQDSLILKCEFLTLNVLRGNETAQTLAIESHEKEN